MIMSKTRVVFFIFSVVIVCSVIFPDGMVMADNKDTGKEFSLSDVNGRYGFSFDGEVVGVGAVAAIGYIQADGNGNIPDAERSISMLGESRIDTFSCTYTIDSNGKGSATCTLDSPAAGFPEVETFDYVLEQNGKAFRMIGTTPGVTVVGEGHR